MNQPFKLTPLERALADEPQPQQLLSAEPGWVVRWPDPDEPDNPDLVDPVVLWALMTDGSIRPVTLDSCSLDFEAVSLAEHDKTSPRLERASDQEAGR